MAKATITIQNDVRCRIEGAFDDKALDDLLSFVKNKFWFRSAQARMGMWDGKTHLFHRHSGTFPTGLLGMVKRWLKQEKVKYRIVDQRTSKPMKWNPENLWRLGGGVKLRRDQYVAAVKALKKERGIVHGATGAGKTEIAAAIIQTLGKPSTLFLTGRKKLARQTRERFAERLRVKVSDIGFIQGGRWWPSKCGVYVAVVDTLTQKKFEKERRELYNTCKLLFIDEAHHSGSTTWYNTLIHCKARYRIGLTGTPIGRSDGGDLYLRAVTGGVVARIRSKELIDKGILAKPTIYFTKVKRPVVFMTEQPWNEVYKEAIVENDRRNDMIIDYVNQLQALGKRTLVLVKEKEHGKLLEEALVDCKFLHGSLEDEEIDSTVRDLEQGELSTIIATSIFDEGVDVVCINALVNVAGGKSPITTLQRIGRGLRKKQGDNRLIVLDFYDSMETHLAEHSRARVEICKREGFKTVILKHPAVLADLL